MAFVASVNLFFHDSTQKKGTKAFKLLVGIEIAKVREKISCRNYVNYSKRLLNIMSLGLSKAVNMKKSGRNSSQKI